MTSLRFALLATALAFAGPALAQSVTITGTNGGTVQSDRNCTRVPGQTTCSQSTIATSANGSTAARNRQRVTGQGSSSTAITGTGPNGQTTSRNRTIAVTH